MQKLEELPHPTKNKTQFEDILHENTSTEYRKATEIAVNCITDFLKKNTQPFSGIKPSEIKEMVEAINLDNPAKDYSDVFSEIKEIYVDHATAFHLPNYIAHLNCPVVIPALAAEIIVSAINSSQDTYDQSAGGTFIERKLIRWTGSQIGFGNQRDGIFTAGGSQSNLMGLLLARDYYALNFLNHNIKLEGNPPEASKFRIFISEKSHFSNQKNASLMGLGEQAIIKIKTDNRFRMIPEALEVAVKNELALGNIPIAIIGTAGTTDFGSVDPLDKLSSIAENYKLWLHVDAAYGCGLLLTDKYKYLLNGIDKANSVTVDYHKSFFQPISSSALIVRDKVFLNIIKHHVDYLNPKDQDYEALPAQINKSLIQSTRRFDALKLWFTLRIMGREKLGKYINKTIETAHTTAKFIDASKEFELVNYSDLGALVFRYVPTSITNVNLSVLNQHIKKVLFFEGKMILASTKVDGEFYLKFTILNPITTIEHTKNILKAIKQHGDAYLQS